MPLVVGCISDVYVNGIYINFDKSERKENVLNGCIGSVDLCRGAHCHSGYCYINSSFESGYKCQCSMGYTGEHCDERKIFIITVINIELSFSY